MINFLKEEHVNSDIIREIEGPRADYPVNAGDQERIPTPRYQCYGWEIWEQTAAVLSCDQNPLLVGLKATGKNIPVENLVAALGHPPRDISFHVNMDGTALVGADTFEGNRVVFRPRPMSCRGVSGGFGILDEINMARNETLAAFHSILDFRRVIGVPCYNKIKLREETRFIATMNYGCAGTRELDEVSASQFVTINIPVISQGSLERLLRIQFPRLRSKYARQFASLFQEIRIKCRSGEISIKPLDLRRLLSALKLMEVGMRAYQTLDMGITNKFFDPYEQTLIRDMIRGRIPKRLDGEKLSPKRIWGRASTQRGGSLNRRERRMQTAAPESAEYDTDSDGGLFLPSGFHGL